MSCVWILKTRKVCGDATVDGNYCKKHAYEMKRNGGSQKKLSKELFSNVPKKKLGSDKETQTDGCKDCKLLIETLDSAKDVITKSRCCLCKMLRNGYIFYNEGKAYHEKCYEQKFGLLTCVICKKTATRKEFVTYPQGTFHHDCLKKQPCYLCLEPLKTVHVTMWGDMPAHIPCVDKKSAYLEHFANRELIARIHSTYTS